MIHKQNAERNADVPDRVPGRKGNGMKGLTLFLIITWTVIALMAIAGIAIAVFLIYRRKKGERTPAQAMKLSWSVYESLTLSSEKIREFLSQKTVSGSDEYRAAVNFFRNIQAMMDDSSWVVTRRQASFHAINRTGGTLRSLRVTVDFFADDRLFYSMETTRALIEEGKPVEFSEEIILKPEDTGSAPDLEGRFREYTVEIAETHPLFNNSFVRGVAGIAPMEKRMSPFEEFAVWADKLPEDLREKANAIIDIINRMIKMSSSDPQSEHKISSFNGRYFPTLTKAIRSFCLHPDEKKEKELRHSLEVMSVATENFSRTMSGNEDDMTSIEQNILEQQLIREGLYSPFEDRRD